MEISVEQLREVFSDAINSIKSDRDLWTADKKEKAVHRLKSHDLMESNRTEFYRVNEIAIKELDGLITWSPRYLNECLNDVYIKLISGILVRDFEWLMETLFDLKTNQELPDILNEIRTIKKDLLELKQKHRVQGKAITNYINTKGNGANGLLYDRFEIVKELNTEYGQHNQNACTSDYPFFKVNGSQFYEFEYVYRFMQILKSITDITEEKNHFRLNPIFAGIKSELILLKVLQKFDAIDNEHKAVGGVFMPICDAFWDNYFEDPLMFSEGTKKTQYKKYLNSKYHAGIKQRLSNGEKHRQKVDGFVKGLKLYKELVQPT